MLIPNKETEPVVVDEYIIKAYLKIRFINASVHRATVEEMRLSLSNHTGSGEAQEIIPPIDFPDVYPAEGPFNTLNKVPFADGLIVEGRTKTPYYWFWYDLEIPRQQVESIGSGHRLRLTMKALEQSPSVTEIHVDWESARHRKSYLLSQNVGSIPSS